MPDEILPWNEENLCAVLTDLNTQAIHDQVLHQQLMTDPFSLISLRIEVPPEYQKNFFAKPQDKPGMLISVPAYQGEATGDTPPAPASVSAQYVIYCSVPIW